jgi:hypothetical protein
MIAIESQFGKLVSIFYRLNAVEFIDSIIRQENPLESWAVVEALYRLYKVPTQVDFC